MNNETKKPLGIVLAGQRRIELHRHEDRNGEGAFLVQLVVAIGRDGPRVASVVLSARGVDILLRELVRIQEQANDEAAQLAEDDDDDDDVPLVKPRHATATAPVRPAGTPRGRTTP